jgi:hypothetical protein
MGFFICRKDKQHCLKERFTCVDDTPLKRDPQTVGKTKGAR